MRRRRKKTYGRDFESLKIWGYLARRISSLLKNWESISCATDEKKIGGIFSKTITPMARFFSLNLFPELVMVPAAPYPKLFSERAFGTLKSFSEDAFGALSQIVLRSTVLHAPWIFHPCILTHILYFFRIFTIFSKIK